MDTAWTIFWIVLSAGALIELLRSTRGTSTRRRRR